LATNIDLILPFVDLEVIHIASSFPTCLKVESSRDALRKPVLRETARLFGLSEKIARRPKKAMQYGSGAHKAIQRLAKMRGYRWSREYVASVFWEVFAELH
jgi:asparagine synthase (glutamine-hydrolysing)